MGNGRAYHDPSRQIRTNIIGLPACESSVRQAGILKITSTPRDVLGGDFACPPGSVR